MASIIIELAVGWFLIYKVPGIVGVSGNIATIIKIIGVLLLIGGFVSFVHYVIRF